MNRCQHDGNDSPHRCSPGDDRVDSAEECTGDYSGEDGVHAGFGVKFECAEVHDHSDEARDDSQRHEHDECSREVGCAGDGFQQHVKHRRSPLPLREPDLRMRRPCWRLS